MSGISNDAQQKVSEMLQRKAPYIKCIPHGINQVMEHGWQESWLLGKTFETLERIFVFFTKSPKRNKKLKGNLLKTRWAARAVSVKAVWRGLQAILLVSLQNSKGGEMKTKASSLLNFVRNIFFFVDLLFLKMWCSKQKCCPTITKARFLLVPSMSLVHLLPWAQRMAFWKGSVPTTVRLIMTSKGQLYLLETLTQTRWPVFKT